MIKTYNIVDDVIIVIALWLCSFGLLYRRRWTGMQPNHRPSSKWKRDAIRLATGKDMWSFLIPQRHTHKCMFNKTKINCPMSAIVRSALSFHHTWSCVRFFFFFFNHHHLLFLFTFFLFCWFISPPPSAAIRFWLNTRYLEAQNF